MSSVHDLLKARLAHSRRELGLVLARLSDADVDWAPAAGMRTVGGQIMEIADKEVELPGWLRTGVWVEVEDFDPHAPIAAFKSRLDDIRADTLAYIDSLTEDDLEVPVSNPELWWEGLKLPSCPRHEVIRNLAAHEWYHTGQLVTYLWMRGDDPDNW